MTKENMGSKRTCAECGARFFDLKKKNPECPKCGTVCEDPKPAKPRRRAARSPVAPTPGPTPGPTPAVAADEAAKEAQDPTLATENKDEKTAEDKAIDSLATDDEVAKNLDDADDEDELIEDTSDLGKDTDDVSEVMEHVDNGVADKS